jgi:phage FluMu protein Com
MDDTSIALHAPLPDGSAEAIVEWRAPRGGLRPGDMAVARLAATHANITTVDLDGHRRERRAELPEADRYVAEARALAGRAADQVRRAKGRSAELAADRAGRAATIDLTCPHCTVSREYRGRRDVMTVGKPDEIGREDLTLARRGSTAYHEYACPRCGSVELFVPGPLDHPLPRPAGTG